MMTRKDYIAIAWAIRESTNVGKMQTDTRTLVDRLEKYFKANDPKFSIERFSKEYWEISKVKPIQLRNAENAD